jgi:hypothetical protein
MMLVLLEGGCVPAVLIERGPGLSAEPIRGRNFVLTWLPASECITGI